MVEQQSKKPPYQYSPEYLPENEISLKELILKVIEFWEEWKRCFLLVAAGALICGGIFLGNVWKKKASYTSILNFVINQNEDGIRQNDLNYTFGGVQKNAADFAKLSEIARSGQILHKVILSKHVINNKYDYMGNHIIDSYDFHSQWAKETTDVSYDNFRLDNFYFKRDTVSDFTPREKRALSILQDLIAGNRMATNSSLMTLTYDRLTDIFRLRVTTNNDLISTYLINSILENLQIYYLNESVGRPKRAYGIISSMVDSMRTKLVKIEQQYAVAKDRRGFTSSLSELNLSRLQRERDMISAEYNNYQRTEKQLELLLSDRSPEFIVIDQTFFPIKSQASKKKSLITGCLLGGFIMSIFVFFRKIIRDALRS